VTSERHAEAASADLQLGLRALLGDRHGPQARALFVTLSKYIERRVFAFVRSRAADIIGDGEMDELVGEVLFQLMAGSLAQFRGGSLPELLAFVRTVTDRFLWRTARQRLKERTALEQMGDLTAGLAPERADETILLAVDPSIDARDREYLEALLQVGSKAAFARKVGVSRAAVTKRVDRIRARIAALPPLERQAAEAWLVQAARVAARAG
jgi:hypothetical protein